MASHSIPLVDLRQLHRPYRRAIRTALDRIISTSSFVLGPEVEAFEQDFARFLGVSYALGVSNGTDAIRLALQAVGVRPGDEVIVPTLSFAATAFSVVHAGAIPRFVDVDLDTGILDPKQLRGATNSKTRAIIPVHLFGHPADMDPILAFARKAKLKVIEDAAQAHGAKYKGNRVGTFGDASAFSFYPSKNLGAMGDGGAVATSNPDVAAKVRRLRNQGQDRKYYHLDVGTNNRLDSFQAAILKIKLRGLDLENMRRRRNALEYARLLKGTDAMPLRVRPWAEPVYHLYIVRHPQRDIIANHLTSKGIACGVYYPIPLHLQQCFRYLGYKVGDLPNAEKLSNEVLALPMYGGLTRSQILRVSREVRASLRP